MARAHLSRPDGWARVLDAHGRPGKEAERAGPRAWYGQTRYGRVFREAILGSFSGTAETKYFSVGESSGDTTVFCRSDSQYLGPRAGL
jgi:hypothetical protein